MRKGALGKVYGNSAVVLDVAIKPCRQGFIVAFVSVVGASLVAPAHATLREKHIVIGPAKVGLHDVENHHPLRYG